MAKNTSHGHSHHHFIIPLIILVILAGLLTYKFVKTKNTWKMHVVVLQQGLEQNQTDNSIKDAEIIAATITTIPKGSPLFTNPTALQGYIENLSKISNRNILILDKNKKILASQYPTSVGLTYNMDNGEIAKTLFDAVPRSFIEKSTIFPNGVTLEVVQIKDSKGTIVGTVLISPANTSEN